MNPFAPVRQLMSSVVESIQVDAPLSQARSLLASRPFNHVPVLHGDVLVGILSRAGLARVSLEAWVSDEATVTAWLDVTTTVSALMTHEPETIGPDATLREAAGRLAEGRFHALPVVGEDGVLEGIVTTTDILRYLAVA